MTGSPTTAKDDEAEVCPNCGEFGDLIDETGWCIDCSGIQALRISAWLQVNADHIEYHISRGLSFRKAVLRVNADTRPTCAVCGKPMLRAKRNAIICRRSPECRKVSRRYVYLYSEKGLTKAEALVRALNT